VNTVNKGKLFPRINCHTQSEIDYSIVEAIAVPFAKSEETSALEIGNPKLASQISKYFGLDLTDLLSQWPDATGKAGELIEIPIKSSGNKLSRIYLIGVGANGPDDLRKAGSALARKVKNTGVQVLDLLVTDKQSARVHAVALVLASYSWSEKSAPAKALKAAHFIIVGNFTKEIVSANSLALGVWRARDLIHTPSNIKSPLWIADQAKSLVARAKSPALKIEIKSGAALAKFGGLLAVGNSAPKPGPRLVQVSYSPKGSKSWPHVVLVGKGITFDTGGVSLKRPYESMVGMKSDMAGAAAVLATVIAIAEMGADAPKVRVTSLLMCAENALSSTSQRPSDVITHFGGTTVEVINTDAEGRLVLADGLAYADAELDPDYLIDVATLTGSATLGLGRQYAAMYTRDVSLAQNLYDSGQDVGERVWHMPLIDDYKVALASEIADFNHTAEKPDFNGGSITAALFLEHFAGKRRWVHLDIAGPARSENDSGENPKGGTGFGVRLLTEWLTSL
jgi:leucyl aminopeptidase